MCTGPGAWPNLVRGPTVDQSTIARFWSKVNPNGPINDARPELGPCWLWLGEPGSRGYGFFWYEGKKRLVHRWSWELFKTAIADGLVIDHLCRNTMCIRPDHLEPVTDRVNILRGEGPAARNVLATECWKGHPFDFENTYWYPNGDRGCKTCQRERTQEWRGKNDPPSGLGKGGHQRAKTHCPAGHEYTPENTYNQPGGGRQCRLCVRIRNREAQRRKRAAAKAAESTALF